MFLLLEDGSQSLVLGTGKWSSFLRKALWWPLKYSGPNDWMNAGDLAL